jgi:MFS family permease
MILPLCGGKIIDKLGKGNGLIITSVILTAGQILITIGGKYEKFTFLVLGRGLFGIGNETMFVT